MGEVGEEEMWGKEKKEWWKKTEKKIMPNLESNQCICLSTWMEEERKEEHDNIVDDNSGLIITIITKIRLG